MPAQSANLPQTTDFGQLGLGMPGAMSNNVPQSVNFDQMGIAARRLPMPNNFNNVSLPTSNPELALRATNMSSTN